MTMPQVAIVILNWNGKNWLEKFLPSVLASTYVNKRIIVADNASNDNSIDFLQINFPTVEIIINKTNEGFAKGYNTALLQVKSDYYVLLNSDVEVSPKWIEPIIELMEMDNTIGVCQPKMLDYNNKNIFEYAGACGGLIDYLGYPLARGRVFDTCEQDESQFETNTEVFWASGAALFVRANLYHQLNGLDEQFFAHQEEIDFCWRIQLSGYKVYVCPASKVYHVGGGTLQQGSSRKTYLNFRNNLMMLQKNLPKKGKFLLLIKRNVLNNIAALQFLLKGDFKSFWAVIKAHWSFFIWKYSHRNNYKNDNNKKLHLLKGVVCKSIVYQYFIKKKKTYNQIMDC